MRERPDFIRLVAGQGVSAVGDGVNRIAILWWARQATGSDAIVVLVALATVLPSLAAAPLAGWLVDRLPRRRLMLAADAIRAITSAALAWAVWAGTMSTAFVIVMAVVAAAAAAVFDPALMASVTLLVPEDELVTANSLLGGTLAVAGIAGPALGGVFVGVFGTGPALVVDAATFLVSFVLVMLSRVPDPVRADATAGEGAWAGFRLLRDDRSIRDLVVVAAGLNLCVAPLTVLVVGLAAGPLHLGGGGFGLLAAAVPLGIVLGFVIAPRVGRATRSALVALLATGGFLAAAGAGPWAVWAGLAFVFAGVGVGVTNSVLPARFQAGVAPEVQGRVFALVGALGQAGRPAGLMLAAPLIALVGVRGGFVVCGLALAAVAWLGRRGLAGSPLPVGADDGPASMEFDECLR